MIHTVRRGDDVQDSIGRRLFKIFILSTIVPMVAVIGVITTVFSLKYHNDSILYSRNYLDLVTANITSYLDTLNQVTMAPYFHSYFQQRAANPGTADGLQSMARRSAFETEMRQLINLTKHSRDDLEDILVTSNGEVMYYSAFDWQNYYFSNGNALENTPWYKKALSSPNQLIFVPELKFDQQNSLESSLYLTIARRIVNLADLRQVNTIMLRVSTRHLERLAAGLDSFIPYLVLITDRDGNYLYSTRPLSTATVSTLAKQNRVSFDKVDWESLSSSIEDYGWGVKVLVSRTAINVQTTRIFLISLGLYLIGLGLAAFMFARYSTWISRSFQMLERTMRSVEEGDFSARCSATKVREIDKLGASLDQMIGRLDEKIKSEYLLAIQQKNSELRALQTQLQPHFILNTLSSFICLNQDGERARLEDGFYSLSRMLHHVMARDSTTTVGTELYFLESYCSLQKLRFDDRFSYSIFCDAEARDRHIPHLLVQPIVENAVIHGIEPCEHPCTLTIEVRLLHGELSIVVEDDGVGFEMADTGTEQFGLFSVTERLRLWMPAASFTIESALGKGTRGELLIPTELPRL